MTRQVGAWELEEEYVKKGLKIRTDVHCFVVTEVTHSMLRLSKKSVNVSFTGVVK